MTDHDVEQGRQAGEFTEEESRVHHAGFKIILKGLEEGLTFDEACKGLQIVDPEMRRIIISDYLKVTIAERHFQAKESIEDVAAHLRCTVETVEKARDEMVREVQEAAHQYYKKQAGAGEEEGASGEPGGTEGTTH